MPCSRFAARRSCSACGTSRRSASSPSFTRSSAMRSAPREALHLPSSAALPTTPTPLRAPRCANVRISTHVCGSRVNGSPRSSSRLPNAKGSRRRRARSPSRARSSRYRPSRSKRAVSGRSRPRSGIAPPRCSSPTRRGGSSSLSRRSRPGSGRLSSSSVATRANSQTCRSCRGMSCSRRPSPRSPRTGSAGTRRAASSGSPARPPRRSSWSSTLGAASCASRWSG